MSETKRALLACMSTLLFLTACRSELRVCGVCSSRPFVGESRCEFFPACQNSAFHRIDLFWIPNIQLIVHARARPETSASTGCESEFHELEITRKPRLVPPSGGNSFASDKPKSFFTRMTRVFGPP